MSIKSQQTYTVSSKGREEKNATTFINKGINYGIISEVAVRTQKHLKIIEEIICWHLGYKGMSKVSLMLQYYKAWRYDSTYSIDLESGLDCLLHN
jgi:hypothetical protein